MKYVSSLQSLSDDELLHQLVQLVSQSRFVEAELVAHIAEVDERRLYASQACSSMFVYAVEVLHLSEHEAYERITAARASRKYPQLLEMLSDGRLHLSGLGKLGPHLTEENWEVLLARAAHKTKRQIEELLVELSPKPDAPALIRKLPEPAKAPSLMPPAELGPDRVASIPPSISVPIPARPVVEPLAPSRYKIQFTASGQLRDKLERLQSLMNEDLTAVIEVAVTEKLERLEAKRFAEVKKPRKGLGETDTSAKTRYIPAAVKRAVRKRDGDRCRFVDPTGRRCTERRGLQFHHHDPFGYGGDHHPSNLSLYCKRHNAYSAERDFGKEAMDRHRGNGDRVLETPPIYGLSSQFDGVYRWSRARATRMALVIPLFVGVTPGRASTEQTHVLDFARSEYTIRVNDERSPTNRYKNFQVVKSVDHLFASRTANPLEHVRLREGWFSVESAPGNRLSVQPIHRDGGSIQILADRFPQAGI
ncbi:MAG TPA: HNH endonuclease, partial [Vicinamibacteria bacterium]|nr:HNH endonuclease [Vicinamibacteria bacterium]